MALNRRYTMQYKVFDANNKEVKENDEITSFRGEKCFFVNCKHPRKITVRQNKQSMSMEYFPGVFNLVIREMEN